MLLRKKCVDLIESQFGMARCGRSWSYGVKMLYISTSLRQLPRRPVGDMYLDCLLQLNCMQKCSTFLSLCSVSELQIAFDVKGNTTTPAFNMVLVGYMQ